MEINKYMSKYTIEKTYSLQLAIAMVPKSGNYQSDFTALRDAMNKTKASMIMTKPLGALPVMRTEIKTGYPVSEKSKNDESTESLLKKAAGEDARRDTDEAEKKLESLITEKGVDSTVAVVHIDGNSMGIRIRSLIEEKTTYREAVAAMRKISYNIQSSFTAAFDKTYQYFNQHTYKDPRYEKKTTSYYLTKVLTAGDDITYVCNGPIALQTVAYFVRQVTQYTLTHGVNASCTTEKGLEDIRKYGFSVCTGISYISSHFPFSIGYDVAEECCGSAKERAKKAENIDNGRIGNWVDFAVCRNVQARSFKAMRKSEYTTASGESLLLRPFFIPAGEEKNQGQIFNNLSNSVLCFDRFIREIRYFNDKKAIPRSHAKAMRNTYALGEKEMAQFLAFLSSRGITLPDGPANTETAYMDAGDGEEKTKTARYYDALEMMDLLADEILAGENKEE